MDSSLAWTTDELEYAWVKAQGKVARVDLDVFALGVVVIDAGFPAHDRVAAAVDRGERNGDRDSVALFHRLLDRIQVFSHDLLVELRGLGVLRTSDHRRTERHDALDDFRPLSRNLPG